ncbi:MAG TPA: patatin-like phospholipase family protein [Phototrophicaceae bacterium]|jgi:hypothetical protein|nr:patatin-like phospholipase family protein [Phototrophicaceae bacterium]
MVDIQPRENYAITVDGGGMKGLMVAQALVDLERELVGDNPLISDPRLKILVGTSTGSVIAACIAAGMRAKDIVKFYTDASHVTFPPLMGGWLPSSLRFLYMAIKGMVSPSLYSNQPFIDQIKANVKQHLGNENATLGDLSKWLEKYGPDKSVIITTGEIANRRTHFLKTSDPDDADWKLWEAVLSSSSAPTIFPVYTRTQNDNCYFTDGGVGAQGNPVYVAVQEAIKWRGYDPSTLTIFSFGTGWQSGSNYIKAVGKPSGWHILDWASNGSIVIIHDVARTQSIDVIERYCNFDDYKSGMDFRRFQIALDQDFDPFASADENNQKMVQHGIELGKRVLTNRHAFVDYPTNQVSNELYDPEELVNMYVRYKNSLARSQQKYAASAAQSLEAQKAKA